MLSSQVVHTSAKKAGIIDNKAARAAISSIVTT